MNRTFLQDIVKHIKPSGSPCDPIPPHFLKEAGSGVGQSILTIVNSSLLSGDVPVSFMHAMIQSLLKKPSLDQNIMSNFRPISKLPFISKVFRKIVLSQITPFLYEHKIMEVFFNLVLNPSIALSRPW